MILRAAFSSAGRRDTILADIQSRAASKQRWGVDVAVAVPTRMGANGLYAELRFVSSADAEELRARVESFATGVRTPLAGSYLIVHNCTHDEGTDDCAVVATRTW